MIWIWRRKKASRTTRLRKQRNGAGRPGQGCFGLPPFLDFIMSKFYRVELLSMAAVTAYVLVEAESEEEAGNTALQDLDQLRPKWHIDSVHDDKTVAVCIEEEEGDDMTKEEIEALIAQALPGYKLVAEEEPAKKPLVKARATAVMRDSQGNIIGNVHNEPEREERALGDTAVGVDQTPEGG